MSQSASNRSCEGLWYHQKSIKIGGPNSILEKNGFELFPQKKHFKILSIFSPENESFYEVKPVPNESPVTHIATHAKKLEATTKKFEKSTLTSKKVIFSL